MGESYPLYIDKSLLAHDWLASCQHGRFAQLQRRRHNAISHLLERWSKGAKDLDRGRVSRQSLSEVTLHVLVCHFISRYNPLSKFMLLMRATKVYVVY